MSRASDPLPDSDGALLRAYFLDRLASEESERLELRLLAEDDLFLLAEAILDELTIDAAAGSLTAPERRRLEQLLAASPQGRAQLALSRSLARIAPRRRPEAAFGRSWRRAAAAAVFLATIGGSLLLWSTHPRGGAVAVHRPVPIAPLALVRPSPRVALLPLLPSAAPAAAAVRPRRALQEQARRLRRIPVVLAAILRGEGPGPDAVRVEIAAGESIELAVEVDEEESYPTYVVTVSDNEGRKVSGAGGSVRRSPEDGTLVVPFPAAKVPAGRYELKVEGKPEQGDVDVIGVRDLEVIHR